MEPPRSVEAEMGKEKDQMTRDMHVRHVEWCRIISSQAFLHNSSNTIFITDILCIYAVQDYERQTSEIIKTQNPQFVKV